MNKPKDELLNRVSVFDDNDIIVDVISNLSEQSEDRSHEQRYWLKEAASQMEGMYALLMDFKKDKLSSCLRKSEANSKLIRMIVIPDLDLHPKTVRLLHENRVRYLSQLLNKTPAQLLQIHNFGEKTLTEVTRVLSDLDMSLKSD